VPEQPDEIGATMRTFLAALWGLVRGSLDEAVIDRLMGTTMSMLDMYLPAVLSVTYGNEPPKDTIRCVEARHCNGGEAESDERGADD